MTKKTSSLRSPPSPHPLHVAVVAPCADVYGERNLSMSIANSPANTLSASRATPPLPPRQAHPAPASSAQAPPLTQPCVFVATVPRRATRSSPPAVAPHDGRAALLSPLAQHHASSTSSSTPAFVAPCSLSLTRVPARAGSAVLTLAAARAALAAPFSLKYYTR